MVAVATRHPVDLPAGVSDEEHAAISLDMSRAGRTMPAGDHSKCVD
jgi:hypothetical protein